MFYIDLVEQSLAKEISSKLETLSLGSLDAKIDQAVFRDILYAATS